MKKVHHLQNWRNCKPVLTALEWAFEHQEDRKQKITLGQLTERTGSFELLFNRREMKNKSFGFREQTPSKQDYLGLIFKDDTFLILLRRR